MPVVEIPLLRQGGVARSAGVVRNDDSKNQIEALYTLNLCDSAVVVQTLIATDDLPKSIVSFSLSTRDHRKKTRIRILILLALFLFCAALSAGCASTPSGDAKPKYAGFLSDYSKLQPVPNGDGAERYRTSPTSTGGNTTR